MSNRFKGNTALIFTALIWGSGFITQKFGMAYVGPFTFNSLRQCVAACLLVPYAIYLIKKDGTFSAKKHSEESIARRRGDLVKASLVCGLLLFCGSNLQQIGLMTVSAGKSGFITAIYIVITPIIAALFGESVRPRIWLCVAMAMAGFALLSLRGGFGETTTGDWLTLASAFFFAAQIIAINKYVTRTNALLIAAGQVVVSAVLGLACAVIFEHPTWALVATVALPILYTGIVPTGIGNTLQVIGQKYTEPAVASLIMSLEGVFAAILGVIFLHEHMMTREAVGCALIFIATVISQMPDREPTEPGPY